MIRVIIICGLVFVGIAAPVEDETQAQILSSENESDGKGNYKFSFEASNGIIRRESGTVVNEGQPDQHIKVEGFISFEDSNGKIENFHYVADRNGYQILPQAKKTVFPISYILATLTG